MAVKIIGGELRGFILETPKTETTRPTSVMVRRKLYDWRQHWDDYFFVDLCAGSGSMAFEALSRGAEKVYCNDSARGAFLTLKNNKEKLEKGFGLEGRIKISSIDATMWVQKELNFEIPDTENCVIFLDPPYDDHPLYFGVIKILTEQGFKGEVWVESDVFKGPKKDALTSLFKSIIKIVEHSDHFVVVGKLV